MTPQPIDSRSMSGLMTHQILRARPAVECDALVDHQSLTGLGATPAVEDQHQHTKQSLEDLPNELLNKIIRQVQSTDIDNYKDTVTRLQDSVYVLAQCSSRFHDLALPVLYNRVYIGETKSLPKFLCRILARPDLARSLRAFEGVLLASEGDMSSITDIDYSRISNAIRVASRSDDEAESWFQSIRDGNWDAMIALVLSIVPNIQELSLINWWYSGDDRLSLYTPTILQRAFDLQNQVEVPPLAMVALREIKLRLWPTENNGELVDTLISFLRLGTLDSFYLNGMSQELEMRKPRWNDLRFTLVMKELTFTSCDMHHEMIITFFRCFSSLERLYYQHGGPTEQQHPFEPPYLMAALNHLKPCLKEITIFNDAKPGSSELESYPIGSFAAFRILTSIDADASILVGTMPYVSDGSSSDDHDGVIDPFKRSQRLVDAIPKTLEHLSIRNCDTNIVPYLFELIPQKVSCSPNLKRLSLGWEIIKYSNEPKRFGPIIHPGFSKEEAERLMAECKNAAIKLTITHKPPPTGFVRLPF